ncbi:hypothetical protein ACIQCD_22560 [Streptomyces sp. NPDC093250]|uniref:hypothetical protein n=1 Tax=unclassified Streptomyces TaxID=2593676 RepID=UPI0033C1FFC7
MKLLMVAALAGGMVTAFGGPAQAAVSGCKAEHSGNVAWGACTKGFGSYRVAAKCDSPNYPYSITIYGPWKSRSTGDGHVDYSDVDGDAYACHIVRAWVDVH